MTQTDNIINLVNNLNSDINKKFAGNILTIDLLQEIYRYSCIILHAFKLSNLISDYSVEFDKEKSSRANPFFKINIIPLTVPWRDIILNTCSNPNISQVLSNLIQLALELYSKYNSVLEYIMEHLTMN